MNSLQLAWRIRLDMLEMAHDAQASHIGSVYSLADIVAVLYNDAAHVDPGNPRMEDRDRIILSKGHAGGGIYAALAEMGFFDREELKTFYADGSRLSGHVSHKGVSGVEVSTGSLGHGIGMGVGMALAASRDKRDHYVYVICGDGECDEGSVWEAALFAGHFKLDHFILIIDHNNYQSLDTCENTISLNPLGDKWRAFGWNVIETDGHDHTMLRTAFCKAKCNAGSPTVIIAHTIKGKGVSFMENSILWHYRYPHDGEEYDTARQELQKQMPPDTEETA